ncbi:MAG TPA: DUF4124 domain-containing protein [Usitatibacter sp.]|nr:DUF4124 domain-containing protein [Usitatibacter sp.]
MKTLCLAVSAVMVLPAQAAFKCVDEKGRTHIGDTPPEQCAKVVMYEVTRTGTVLRTIQPTLTEEQVKARIAEDEKRKEGEKVAGEQKRKDLALLATYSSEAEVDVARDRNVEPIQGRIKLAKERITAIDKRNKELDEELEFYKAGKSSKAGAKKVEAPPMMVEEQARLKHEKQVVTKSIAGYEKEITDLTSKYAVDKKRWLALKTGGGAAAVDPKPGEPKPVEAKAEAKAEPKAPAKKTN